ncbi:MAG: hypothetical protein JXR03_03350 [Cyclobacteriaceae bacterium]
MMFRKPWIKYKIKRNEKKRGIPKAVDFNKSTKIGFIFSEDSDSSSVKNILDDLSAEGKEISTLAFCKNKSKITLKHPVFDTKDVSTFGDFKSEELDAFMKQKYDIVFCPDSDEHYLIHYLLSKVNAKCRVGITDKNEKNHFEMILRKTKGAPLKSREVLKYLKMIQSNEH